MSQPTLVLLTAAYPFGNKSETFLESEIGVLAERFGAVLVVPSHRAPGTRALPDGVELVEMGWLDEPSAAAKWAALASPAAARVLGSVASRPGNLRPYLAGARTYLDNLARNLLKARELAALVERRGLGDAVFYDYWFENSTLALALLRRSGRVASAVARAHGFDLYDERWGRLRVPFREFKLGGLDRVFPVSEFGAAYLRARAGRHAARVEVRRLGVRAQPEPPPPGPGHVPLVVSCGSLAPFKRVERIPAVLEALDAPVRWVHFGDGPRRAEVEAAARRLPTRVRWELRGHVDNAEVLAFYRGSHVDALVSLSVQEGLPVSMMEAISFGVPLVATAVQGVPEIVNETTGVGLPADASPEHAAAALGRVLAGGFERARIRAFFRGSYEATSNYNAFADALLDLSEAPPAAA